MWRSQVSDIQNRDLEMINNNTMGDIFNRAWDVTNWSKSSKQSQNANVVEALADYDKKHNTGLLKYVGQQEKRLREKY